MVCLRLRYLSRRFMLQMATKASVNESSLIATRSSERPRLGCPNADRRIVFTEQIERWGRWASTHCADRANRGRHAGFRRAPGHHRDRTAASTDTPLPPHGLPLVAEPLRVRQPFGLVRSCDGPYLQLGRHGLKASSSVELSPVRPFGPSAAPRSRPELVSQAVPGELSSRTICTRSGCVRTGSDPRKGDSLLSCSRGIGPLRAEGPLSADRDRRGDPNARRSKAGEVAGFR
jgi:hypothetical protein